MIWPVIKLAKLCHKITDGSHNPPEGVTKSDFMMISSKNIFDDQINFDDPRYLTKEDFISENKRTNVSENDVLLTIVGTVGRVAVVDKNLPNFTLQRSVAVLKPHTEKIMPRFLMYSLRSMLDTLTARSRGVAQKGIYLKQLQDLDISLPSLEEQKRIAAILDKADAIRRKRQEAIKLADEFLRAVFLDMFGDLVTKEGYLKATKSKISEALDYIDYRGKTPEKSDSGVALITAKNVRVGYVDEEPREYIPEENYLAWMTRGFPKENDVLFTTEAPMGNVALLGKYEKVALGQRLIALRSKGALRHEYLMYLLLHPFMQTIIYSRSSGSTVRGIRTKELFEIEIPIPSIDKQEKFSKIYRLARKHINQITASSKSCETLFDSLSSQAFGKQ